MARRYGGQHSCPSECRFMFGRKRIAILGAAGIGAALAGAGVAYSAIPGSDSTIHGCYGRLTGNLRVIDAESGRSCTFLEIPISWNAGGGGGGGLTQVTSADIVDGEVKTVDIHAGAVTPDKLSQAYASAADVTNEASARSSADTALQGAINSETAARTAADAALQNAITSLTSSLNTFKTDLKTADDAANDGDGLVHFTNLDGVQIAPTMIQPGSLTATQLANGAVT